MTYLLRRVDLFEEKLKVFFDVSFIDKLGLMFVDILIEFKDDSVVHITASSVLLFYLFVFRDERKRSFKANQRTTLFERFFEKIERLQWTYYLLFDFNDRAVFQIKVTDDVSRQRKQNISSFF